MTEWFPSSTSRASTCYSSSPTGAPSTAPIHGGKPENHAYQLYLAVEDKDHSRTKANHPQTNGVCERFHKNLQDEFYSLIFRKKLYRTLEELQGEFGRLAGQVQ